MLRENTVNGPGESPRPLAKHCIAPAQPRLTRAARRYQREGRTIRIAFAPAGLDFNDLLQEQAALQ